MLAIRFVAFCASLGDANGLADEKTLINQLHDFAARNVRVRRSTSSTNLTILSFNPKDASTDGGTDVTIVVSGLPPGGSSYCRFDTILSPATLIADDTLRCTAPRHAAGEVLLAVSADGAMWSSDVSFLYVLRGGAVYILLSIFLGISLVSFALFLFQIRQCKNQQKRNLREMPQAFYDGYYTPKSGDPTPLNRKSPPLL
jgi:hypothetical protein